MASDSGLGPAPPETVALWIRAVARMRREALESFVERTWRTWDAESLRELQVAVDARRRELEGET